MFPLNNKTWSSSNRSPPVVGLESYIYIDEERTDGKMEIVDDETMELKEFKERLKVVVVVVAS